MLTKITMSNFKRFGRVEVELGDPVIFIGPNNSGKTSVIQALALWEVGLKLWNEKRGGRTAPERRPGVTINRRDLIAVPVPDANLLWRNLRVRDVTTSGGRQQTRNVRIDIIVEGINDGALWRCGLEFDYANVESFYCRPLRLTETSRPDRMPIPDEAGSVQMAFLPPMSGLAANETRLDPGAINVRVGEGRTAEVLRNLCFEVFSKEDHQWEDLAAHIDTLFGATLEAPRYIPERGEIEMTYVERGIRLDLSSAGRGLQQTLLLLAYMYANPESVLLLDEPDAHLEILRQRQIYQLLIDVARNQNNQIIAASHSEVLLNEAADRDVVVAFVGAPHRIDNRGDQVLKSLRDIGFEDYLQAEQTGWVLYLEGSTDLAILRAFAQKLGRKKAEKVLERPFVKYVGNSPPQIFRHFYGLQEALPHLAGIAVLDRLDREFVQPGVNLVTWKRREIENYICYPEVLQAYAVASNQQDTMEPLFATSEIERRQQAMQQSIQEVIEALQTLGKGSPWDHNTKVSDDFLTPVFKAYFAKLDMPNLMEKKNFHELASLLPPEKFDPEIREKLDSIVTVAHAAMPVEMS